MHETNQFITTKHKSFYNNLNKPLINSHPSIIMRPPTKPAGKDDVAPRKANSPVVKCPRCDSPNTKFCYYNNYSLTQPRHFCKTCRRYWTKGGAMRSVPIGGGSRKNKKMKTSSDVPDDSIGGSSSDIGGVKFFQGIAPAMDFQLGGITPPFPRIPNTALFNFSGSGNLSSTLSATSANPFAFDPSAANFTPGFNFPFSPAMKLGNNFPGSSNLASSIESLSSINQDLHWKLQKQRLSMLLGDAVQKPGGTVQKPQPILFKSLDFSKTDIKGLTKDGGIGNVSTEWFFDNEYGNMSQTPATSGGDVEESGGGCGGGWGGIDQGWSDHDLSGYASLP